jgi:DNA replicative helicase MCM subunit Mcm2 (Cdc46/Mcm family)
LLFAFRFFCYKPDGVVDARKQEIELTQKDIEEILAWKKKSTERKLQLEKEGSGNTTLADQIASYFAPQIISYEYVKKGLLMAAANAGIHNDDKRIPKRMRINALLIGDPSLAKSTFIRKISEIVPNARYESCQSSTGLSLTAQVSKEEGGIYTLRHGPIPLANGSVRIK